MNPFIKKILYLTLGLLSPLTCVCNITFHNDAANLFIDTTTSELCINNPSKASGWTNRSVVKTFGDNASTAWPEAYTNNTVVAQTTGAGITPARTYLINANSNAINVLPTPLRTTSNLLLYTARTYSSSIVMLNRRADSTNRDIRTTSNAINLVYRNLNNLPIADSIDGTLFARYCTNHYVFHNNGNAWTARGWVRFNNGFTVMPLGSVLMDTLTTVSGGFDLRDTGTLILNNDLYLAHNVTLTNGGNIKGQASSSGQANTIFMGGDLTLASTTYARTLHITGDWSNSGTSGNLIIDGCGHTLNIGDRAQIFVDTNVTLTLRNMTIKTGPLSLNNPAIQLASHGSKLALDNVMFDLGADFHFMQGQIFVHNEVAVTGTSAFVYQSPKPSYITSGATLSFEQATTFSVAPSTFTDCPFTVNNTYTNNAFLVLADASSALSLNGCSFQTTFTGLRLRSGMVLFDNKVAIDTTAGVDLNNATPITEIGSGVTTGNGSFFVAWSPDSRFLAVANQIDQTLRIYQFNGNSIPTTIGGATATGGSTYAVSWSSDGRFLAVVNDNGTLRVYRFNGSSTPIQVGNDASTGVSSQPRFASFSPDGRLIAVANINNQTLRIFRFNGVSTPVQIGSDVTTSGAQPHRLAWSPDGRFVAVVSYGGKTLEIYSLRGNSSPALTCPPATLANSGIFVAWSPDERFLAVAVDPGLSYIYRFNGSKTPMNVANTGFGTNKIFVTWSPDGRFLLEGCGGGSNTMRIYRFDQTSSLSFISSTSFGASPASAAWSPDGNFIALVNNSSPGALHVYRCNYVYSGQPAQGFTNGLLFGDKLKGSAFDANVNVLAGAVVKVKGMVKDDSA
jgi:WD40 repeat protein